MDTTSENGDPDAGDYSEGSKPVKRRRLRAALSCTNCQGRKIKCNRGHPCSSCISRGMSETCHWEDLDAKRAAITGANSGWEAALDKMRQEFDARLQKLESTLVSAAAGPFPATGQASTSRSQITSPYKQSSTGPGRLKAEAATPSLAGGKEEEAEDAAIALEALAAGHTPNNMSPVDAMPITSKEAFSRESILDRQHVNPSPVSPKLPWTVTLTARSVVDALLSITESKANVDRLLRYYMDHFSHMHGIIHPPSFKREVEAFWSIVPTLDRNIVDPAWVALYASILSITARCESDCLKDQLADELAEISRAALKLADLLKKPQFRTIQACKMLLMQEIPGGGHSGAPSLHAMIVRTAQALGIHKLGKDNSIMPVPDKSVPTGSLLHRETAVRLWIDIVSYDWTVGEPNFHSRMIEPSDFTTGFPGNYDDEDLEDGDINRPPRPPSQLTKGAVLNASAQSAEFFRKLSDLGPPPASASPDIDSYYATLLVLDREFRKRLESHVAIRAREMHDGHEIVLAVLFNARRLMLHRVLGQRGYNDRRFSASTRIMVECALRILEVLPLLQGAEAGQVILRFVNKHLVSALLTIFIDALHDVDVGASEDVTEAKLANVPAVITLFDQSEQSGIKANIEVAQTGKILISALLDALRERRQMRAVNSKAKAEDYSHVLRRVTKKIGHQIASVNSVSHSTTSTPASSGSGSGPFMGGSSLAGANGSHHYSMSNSTNNNNSNISNNNNTNTSNFLSMNPNNTNTINPANGNSAGFMEDDGTHQLLATLGLVPQSTGMFGQLQTPFDTLGGADTDLAMWNFLSFDGNTGNPSNPAAGNNITNNVNNAIEPPCQPLPQGIPQQQQMQQAQQAQPYQTNQPASMPGFERMW